ncbi:hypothetical protein [Streptomyces sp. SPB074]|uniref:hypothetical protein n=1 Tax=Streptomyces sp. (strain SPB074) TaxID=465543 RepID=UPI0001D1DF4E|nr:hypothetical protein [Streptomyces sp. SPB074]EDY44487.2 conserved hypothetical protein [Streptomyces sp. SPB074]
MEQKQSEANLPPIGAAADPALIPGLTVPTPRTGTDASATDPEAAAETRPGADPDAPGPDAGPGTPAPEAAAATPEASTDAPPAAPAADGDADEADDADAEAEEAGPRVADAAPAGSPEDEDGAARPDAEFTATDRRGSVTLDGDGVRYALDDQACEWTWSEVAAVEYGTSRLGRRLTVTVHTPDERWYPHDVQAPDKATLHRWTKGAGRRAGRALRGVTPGCDTRV